MTAVAARVNYTRLYAALLYSTAVFCSVLSEDLSEEDGLQTVSQFLCVTPPLGNVEAFGHYTVVWSITEVSFKL